MSITHAMQAVAESASELRAALNENETRPATDVVETCPHGHPLTPENRYIRPTGQVHCRACNREDGRRFRQRHAA